MGMAAAERCVAVAGGGDRSSDDPLAFTVTLYRLTEFFDNADRLVPNGQPSCEGILAPQDVDVGAARWLW